MAKNKSKIRFWAKLIGRKQVSGFTLLEMIVVVTIIGIISVLSFSSFQGVQDSTKFDLMVKGLELSLREQYLKARGGSGVVGESGEISRKCFGVKIEGGKVFRGESSFELVGADGGVEKCGVVDAWGLVDVGIEDGEILVKKGGVDVVDPVEIMFQPPFGRVVLSGEKLDADEVLEFGLRFKGMSGDYWFDARFLGWRKKE